MAYQTLKMSLYSVILVFNHIKYIKTKTLSNLSQGVYHLFCELILFRDFVKIYGLNEQKPTWSSATCPSTTFLDKTSHKYHQLNTLVVENKGFGLNRDATTRRPYWMLVAPRFRWLSPTTTDRSS